MSIKFNLKTTAFILLGFIFFTYSCKKDKPGIPKTVTDIDGNVYNTVIIGDQVWMAENLKTTRYRDGSNISHVTDFNQWYTLGSNSEGTYCDYDFIDENGKEYGHLYNWYAVNNPDKTKNLAPKGWRVPTKTDLDNLISFLGGEDVAGGKLKEKGTLHWGSPNNVSIEEYGFNALPNGYFNVDGGFFYLGTDFYMWSTTPFNTDMAENLELHQQSIGLDQYVSKRGSGLAVRCIME